MSEYINRNELLKTIHENPAEAHNERCAQLLEAILNAPTADVVEVVRCKDCKHYCLSDFRKPNEPKWCEMFYDGYFYPKPNDYCFYGERKEENER